MGIRIPENYNSSPAGEVLAMQPLTYSTPTNLLVAKLGVILVGICIIVHKSVCFLVISASGLYIEFSIQKALRLALALGAHGILA